MTTSSSVRRGLIQTFTAVAATVLTTGTAQAGQEDDTPGSPDQEIVVTGYGADRLSTPQRALPLLDTPQTATVVPDQLLSEQGRRTLRDSMRNITGVSFQAGEGNPPGGGDSFSVRGFSARDDIYVDGIRDPGNYFRDPFYAERIEVTGVQRYPKFARIALAISGGAVVQNVTDYLYLDAGGRITRIARFEGDLPPL